MQKSEIKIFPFRNTQLNIFLMILVTCATVNSPNIEYCGVMKLFNLRLTLK